MQDLKQKTKDTDFSIKKMTQLTGLSEDTLRYYEKDGLLSGIKRLPNGHRRYSKHDVEWLNFVLCLRSTGMPLKKIKEYRELMEQGDVTAPDRRALLVSQKKSILKDMENLNDALNRINYKIEYYKSIEKEL